MKEQIDADTDYTKRQREKVATFKREGNQEEIDDIVLEFQYKAETFEARKIEYRRYLLDYEHLKQQLDAYISYITNRKTANAVHDVAVKIPLSEHERILTQIETDKLELLKKRAMNKEHANVGPSEANAKRLLGL